MAQGSPPLKVDPLHGKLWTKAWLKTIASTRSCRRSTPCAWKSSQPRGRGATALSPILNNVPAVLELLRLT